MHKIGEILKKANYFGSHSTNTKEFDDFARSFKKSFKESLMQQLSATDFRYSINHFCISGSFKLRGENIRFDIPDVRDSIQSGSIILYKVGDKNKHTFELNQKTVKNIGNSFNAKFTPTSKGRKTTGNYLNEIVFALEKEKEYTGKIRTAKQAKELILKVFSKFCNKPVKVNINKKFNSIISISSSTKKISAHFDMETKLLKIKIT